MNTENIITLGVGILLLVTAYSFKKRTGQYDWLYIILGILIFCIGSFKIFTGMKL